MKILRRNKKPDDDDENVVLQDIRLNIVSALIHPGLVASAAVV